MAVAELFGREVEGREHWASKGDVRLFLWEKRSTGSGPPTGTKSPTPPSMICTSIDGIQIPLYPPSAPLLWTNNPESRAEFSRACHVRSPHLNSSTR